jgi:hypothetical protein
MSSSLPVELWQQVFHQIKDRSSLLEASLVCRNWRSFISVRLFTSVTFLDRAGPREDLYLDTDADVCFTSIAPLIREVIITASGYSDIPTSWMHIQSFPPAHVEQMRSIVAVLPDLERVVIRAINRSS